MIKSCWKRDPDLRPSFSQLLTTLFNILDEFSRKYTLIDNPHFCDMDATSDFPDNDLSLDTSIGSGVMPLSCLPGANLMSSNAQPYHMASAASPHDDLYIDMISSPL
jgi:hypothetical protein